MAELSCTGIVWLIFSTLAALGASSGFFLPYWLRGTYPPLTPKPTLTQTLLNPDNPTLTATPVFLGTFRRCNYPRLATSSEDGSSRVEMVLECGRYTRFTDIPSLWWQVGTVICGAGSALALLVCMCGAWGLCVRYVMTKGTAKVAALLQLLAGLLIGGGVAVYPLGWDNREVRQVCGSSASPFHLGTCELYWAFYLTASSGGLTLLCSLLALCAPSSKADYT